MNAVDVIAFSMNPDWPHAPKNLSLLIPPGHVATSAPLYQHFSIMANDLPNAILRLQAMHFSCAIE
jgi:hypothetical protein